jgi:hypothetical protein
MPRHPDDRWNDRRSDQRQGGIPDGLILGLLGFLLSLTLLAWTATGLAGLFAHGSWPNGVTFTRTPLAMRTLASAPQDLPGAWPDTPPGELSGHGLFWGLLISQLMVLIVLAVFTLGVVVRYRAVRAHRKEQRLQERYEADDTQRPMRRRPPAPAPTPAQPAPAPPIPEPAVEAPTNVRDMLSKSGPPDFDPRWTPSAPPEPTPRPAAPTPATAPPEPATTSATAPPAPAPSSVSLAAVSAMPAVPSLPAPRVQYGDPLTRRPAAVQAILDAAGPVLVVTSNPAVWSETKDARAKLGPVLVYDPGHLCDTPARLHWSPTAGCEDPATADARGRALLSPVRPHALLDTAVADTAETLLRCWLHAAAVDGRPFKQVHRWAQGGGAREAVRILRTHPKAAAGLAGLLESALTGHPERRDIAQQLTARALSSLSSIHIREACTPNRTDALSLDSFVNEGGTLYVVGEPIEDPRAHPGAMPLLTALASSVVEHGRRMAARSSDGRLDPPMVLVLDDVAAVAPLPHVPKLLATGQDQGLPTLVLLRSRQQGKDRWPHDKLPEPW